MKPSPIRLLISLLVVATGTAFAQNKPVETQSLDKWSFAKGQLELKTSAGVQGVLFEVETAPELRNNYVVGRAFTTWKLPAKGRVEIVSSARQRFASYYALSLVGADGRSFMAVVSGDPKKGYQFTPSAETVSIPLSRFRDAAGNAPEAGMHVQRVDVSFGFEAGVNNAVTIGRIALLEGENPPLSNAPIVVNPEQNWVFQKGPLDLRTGFDRDGMRLDIATQPTPNNNYLTATLRHAWTLPASGRVNVEVKSATVRAHYFALQLLAADGRKFQGVFGGDPKTGFMFSSKASVATVAVGDLRAPDGSVAPAGTAIVGVTLSFGFEAGTNTTLHISKLELVADAD